MPMALNRTDLAVRLMPMAAVACFVLALAYPSVGTCSNNPADHAVHWLDNTMLALFGWLGVLAGQFGWYANITLFCIAMIVIFGRQPFYALLIAHAALLVLGTISLVPGVGIDIPVNEAFSEPICRLGAGFWLWFMANVIGLIAGISARQRFTLKV